MKMIYLILSKSGAVIAKKRIVLSVIVNVLSEIKSAQRNVIVIIVRMEGMKI